MIKCLIFKNGLTLIGEVIEVGGDVGEPDCQLVNPFQIFENGEMNRWPSVTNQRSIMIHSDSILTIVDPNEKIIETYKDLNS